MERITPPPGLLRETEEGFCLSWPWNPARPFLLPELFCFARVSDGKVLLCFDRWGHPRFHGQSDQRAKEQKENNSTANEGNPIDFTGGF